MELPDYVQSVSFRLAHPDVPGSKAFRLATGLLRQMGLPLDALEHASARREPLHAAPAARGTPHVSDRQLRRRSHHQSGRFATGSGEAFLALGVSDGFPLLAAISGNPDKPCIGVDLSVGSEIRSSEGPQFLRRFESLRAADHQLHRLAFRDYFAQLHELPIGCCLIGASTADDPLERLNTAEPHLAENCVVLVENVNDAARRRAVLAFIGSSANQYRVLLDQRTPHHGELTLGNGLLVFQLLGRNAAAKRPLEKPVTPVLVPAA